MYFDLDLIREYLNRCGYVHCHVGMMKGKIVLLSCNQSLRKRLLESCLFLDLDVILVRPNECITSVTLLRVQNGDELPHGECFNDTLKYLIIPANKRFVRCQRESFEKALKATREENYFSEIVFPREKILPREKFL